MHQRYNSRDPIYCCKSRGLRDANSTQVICTPAKWSVPPKLSTAPEHSDGEPRVDICHGMSTARGPCNRDSLPYRNEPAKTATAGITLSKPTRNPPPKTPGSLPPFCPDPKPDGGCHEVSLAYRCCGEGRPTRFASKGGARGEGKVKEVMSCMCMRVSQWVCMVRLAEPAD